LARPIPDEFHYALGPYLLDGNFRTVKLKEFSEGMVPVVIDGTWGYASRDR